jgi:hypothetical protein
MKTKKKDVESADLPTRLKSRHICLMECCPVCIVRTPPSCLSRATPFLDSTGENGCSRASTPPPSASHAVAKLKSNIASQIQRQDRVKKGYVPPSPKRRLRFAETSAAADAHEDICDVSKKGSFEQREHSIEKNSKSKRRSLDPEDADDANNNSLDEEDENDDIDVDGCSERKSKRPQ